jgi:hypothetical protein
VAELADLLGLTVGQTRQQLLARLFSRPPLSVLAKMANLDGSRSQGGKWDILAGVMLRRTAPSSPIPYRLVLRARSVIPCRTPGSSG